MSLQHELGLKRAFRVPVHETLLNIYHTGSRIKKRAREFFADYGITDVQFNVLELLLYQTEENEGLTQAELSRMMLVNRANITSLVDRMEKANLVVRTDVPDDRRFNAVRLTAQGKQVLLDVEEKYVREVARIMDPLSDKEMDQLRGMLERIRETL